MFGTYVVGKNAYFLFSVFCVGVSVVEAIEQKGVFDGVFERGLSSPSFHTQKKSKSILCLDCAELCFCSSFRVI